MDYLHNLNQLIISSAEGMIWTIDNDNGQRVLGRKITDGEIASFDTKTYNKCTYLAIISSYGHIEIAEISDVKSSYNSISHFKA